MKRKLDPTRRPRLRPPEQRVGLVESFRIGDEEHVERVLRDCAAYGVKDLRTRISWAEAVTSAGAKWFDWLFPTLSAKVRVLPCFVSTPPTLGLEARTSSPPRVGKDYADFLDTVVTRHGQHFEWVELWNQPNNLHEWDWRLDPTCVRFAEMVGGAAHWMKKRGKKTVLGGTFPLDPNWLRAMADGGVLQYIDAVAIHGFPGTWEPAELEWGPQLQRVRASLDRAKSSAEVWITETGYSTWNHDERQQLKAFLAAIDAPADRIYWSSAYDLDREASTDPLVPLDERKLHLGLKRRDGTPKLLARLWESGGLEAVREAVWVTHPRPSRRRKHVLITGGAGFIGTNLADRILTDGSPVLVYDNLSRPGVEQNLAWLREKHGRMVDVELADIRNERALRRAVEGSSSVFHFAAQVAVTTSLVDPIHDFEVNAGGAVRLLEAIRRLREPVPVIFTSTNKVYGALDHVELVKTAQRYEPASRTLRARGISEACPLDFHSPYGCSKGTADQYILDYARTFSIPAAVFRMSCIYGPHQFGTEDQGWVAHFLIRALERRPITLYGDGKQVRDVLFVEDLVNAFLLAREHIEDCAGQAFNVGGGPENSISLLELLELIGELLHERPTVEFEDWRLADQRYYVSDTAKLERVTGWQPTVSVRDGVRRLFEWLLEARGLERPIPMVVEVAP